MIATAPQIAWSLEVPVGRFVIQASYEAFETKGRLSTSLEIVLLRDGAVVTGEYMDQVLSLTDRLEAWTSAGASVERIREQLPSIAVSAGLITRRKDR